MLRICHYGQFVSSPKLMMNMVKRQWEMSLSDLNNDIIKLVALKMDTNMLLDLFIYESYLSVLCHNEIFWGEKFAAEYPEYVGELVDGSHIKTMLHLGQERIIKNVANSDDRIKIDVTTTITNFCDNFDGRTTIFVADEVIVIDRTAKNLRVFSTKFSHDATLVPIKLKMGGDTPLYMVPTINGKNLYLEMNSVMAGISAASYLVI